MIPSLADYATHEDAAYPELWWQCVFATAPCLGITGDKLHDFVRAESAAIANYSASRWAFSDGLPAVTYTDGANRHSFWLRDFDANLLSLSMWLKSSGQTASRAAMSLGSTGLTLRLLVGTTGTLTANWSNSAVQQNSTVALTTNKWHHVVAQRSRANGGAVELWIDGLRDVSGTWTTSFTNVVTNICIGGRRDGTTLSAQFGGEIDETRVYQRMLSQDEIRLLAGQRGVSFIRR